MRFGGRGQLVKYRPGGAPNAPPLPVGSTLPPHPNLSQRSSQALLGPDHLSLLPPHHRQPPLSIRSVVSSACT